MITQSKSIGTKAWASVFHTIFTQPKMLMARMSTNSM
jgi:hypothetical protein